jgi:hypothetical protein
VTATAELLPDRGEAAAGEDFFRSRAFLDAEGVTHTLRISIEDGGEGSGELFAPLIVRQIGEGPETDAISPYGYPGLVPPDPGHERSFGRYATQTAFVSEGGALDPGQVDFSATGLVSVFLRHTLGPPPLAQATRRIEVQIADPALPPKSRPTDRRQVRRNLEAGYELALVPGPETTPGQRAGFLDLYEQTMRRAAAAEHYFFAPAYFDRILEADRTWLVLARAPGGELAAASIAVVSDGFLHYYLSGSADAHLADSPMKNVVSRLIEHAAELSLPLNLGGGLRPGDALEEFKRGFANRAEPWFTSDLVCDRDRYERLSAAHSDAGTFFPAYRAPN